MSTLQESVVPLHSRHTSPLSFLVLGGTTNNAVILQVSKCDKLARKTTAVLLMMFPKHVTTNLTDMFTGQWIDRLLPGAVLYIVSSVSLDCRRELPERKLGQYSDVFSPHLYGVLMDIFGSGLL